jgi:nucleoside phosphorylase
MSENQYFDVCIVCALDAEARAFINAAEKWFGAQFQEGYSRNSGPYRHTTLSNHIHEPVTLHLSWLPNTGMVNLALHFKPVLDEFKPHFAGMTGICAGDKSKVKLGDLVIAERAFIGDNGRVTLDEQGHQVTEYDVTTWHTPKNVLHKVRLFDPWRPYVNAIVRPPSKHQQRDWLLNQLLDGQTPSVNDIVRLKRLELEKHAPQWRAIVHELLQGEHPFLTPQRVLRDRSQVDELYFLYDFPYQDPKEAEYNIAPMASVNAIHSDNPFEQIRLPVRQTVAIDLEGAAFYQTVGDMPDMLSLLVKSVSSYADPDKDDTYSTYASTVSAIYMLSEGVS